ncbi:MAG: universal stress protein [Deltaproteobacteria bacterium]|nr:universal stress protein [Deltaproteobacteria bacterium]
MQIRKILVPVDFSPQSEVALMSAIDLAKTLGASITLLHAYEIPVYTLPDGAWTLPAAQATALADDAQRALDELVKKYAWAGVPITAKLCRGAPYEEITRGATETDADLVVIATHGRTGLAHLFLGSVAERVVRTSPVPVLTIRSMK